MSIKRRVKLDYKISTGWLGPYMEALTQGKTLARKCNLCNMVTYPPQKTCKCGNTEITWHELSGKAEIVWRTINDDGDSAMVKFEGSHTHSVACVHDLGKDEKTAALVPSCNEYPNICIGPLPTTKE